MNDLFSLKCFTNFCYCYGFVPSSLRDYNTIQGCNELYGKYIPEPPILLYQNGSFDIDNYFIIDPRDCFYNTTNDYNKLPFVIEFYLVDEQGNIGSTVQSFFNLSYSGNYWDSTENLYKIPIVDIENSLLENYKYVMKYRCFGPNLTGYFFYEYFVSYYTIKIGDYSYGVPEDFGGGGDTPGGATIDDINNTLTDSSVNNDFLTDLNGLGFSVQDNSGIDNFFTILYNAFCSDEVQDVTLNIPFVNKTFTISADTVSNRFPVAVRLIVGVFVWGIVGLWVLKDIRSTVDKIREGSPENSGSDIKKEVL